MTVIIHRVTMGIKVRLLLLYKGNYTTIVIKMIALYVVSNIGSLVILSHEYENKSGIRVL